MEGIIQYKPRNYKRSGIVQSKAIYLANGTTVTRLLGELQ